MSEMPIVAGTHECGRKFDLRTIDVKDDEKKVFAWIIYGICEQCEVVLMQHLLMQTRVPKEDYDFLIDWSKIAEKGTPTKWTDG